MSTIKNQAFKPKKYAKSCISLRKTSKKYLILSNSKISLYKIISMTKSSSKACILHQCYQQKI